MTSFVHRYLIKRSFNRQVRMRTWQKLAMQEKVGVDPLDGIRILLRQAQELKRPEAWLYEKILHGTTEQFALSLVGYVTPEEISLISAAERAGNIGEGFRLSHDFLLNNEHIANVIKRAIWEPSLSVLSLFLLIIGTSKFVIPGFALIYPPDKWKGMASILYKVSQFIDSFIGYFVVSLIPLSVLIVIVTLPTWTGPLRQRVDDHGPWGIYKSIVGLSWLYSVATLLRSNLDISQIFSMMINERNCTPYLRERLVAVQQQFHFGQDFGEALKNSKMNFPSSELVSDIEIYSTLPGLKDNLFFIAKEQMKFDSISIERQMKVLNGVLKSIIALVFGFIVMAGFSIESQLVQGGSNF